MKQHPLTGTIGAEITGIDLRQPISDDAAGSLKDALARRPYDIELNCRPRRLSTG